MSDNQPELSPTSPGDSSAIQEWIQGTADRLVANIYENMLPDDEVELVRQELVDTLTEFRYALERRWTSQNAR